MGAVRFASLACVLVLWSSLLEAREFLIPAMGTIWRLEVADATAADDEATFALEAELIELITRYELTFSDWTEASELRRLERGWPQPQQASALFVRGLELAAQAHESSEGLFDITVGSLLWEARDLSQQRACGFSSVAWEPTTAETWTRAPHCRLSFGGLAKGMAVGASAALLYEHGAKDFYINAGGGNFAFAGSYRSLLPQAALKKIGPADDVVFLSGSRLWQGDENSERQHIVYPDGAAGIGAPGPTGQASLVCRASWARQDAASAWEALAGINDALTTAMALQKEKVRWPASCFEL